MIYVGPDFDEQLDAAATKAAYVPRVTQAGERVWYILCGELCLRTEAKTALSARRLLTRYGLKGRGVIAYGPSGITSAEDPELVRAW